MSGLVENFIRRIEKTVSSYPTVPQQGTNHVDDEWLNTDIYPGELVMLFEAGKLYSSDGANVMLLNSEDSIMNGLKLAVSNSTLTLSISSGSARIDGITYYHTSSGTDIDLPFSLSSKLYFIYGIDSGATAASGAALGFTCSSSTVSSFDEPGGIYSAIAATASVPTSPASSILLGTVLVIGNTTNYLFPLSISKLGDHYPKMSISPSELLRSSILTSEVFSVNTLYFPGKHILDNSSNSSYITKRTFISGSASISTDIGLGNLSPLVAGTGNTGGSYTSTSIGSGTVDVYKTTVANQFQFRSLTGSGLVIVGYTGSSNNMIYIGLTTSGLVTSLSNVGTGATVYAGLTSTSIPRLRSLTAGSSNVTIAVSGDNIVIDVPSIGTTAQGVNRGATADANVYGGMSGNNLSFKRLSFGTGMTGSETGDLITISTTAKDNNGVNAGGGPISIYGGMSGDNLIFKSLTGSSNVSIVQVGNLITISASGSSGNSAGTNIGASGASAAFFYSGLSGSNLMFKSLTTGYGLTITSIGNNFQIDSTVTNGAQGNQGPQGFQGFRGFQGFQGFQGATGSTGTNGTDGAQGAQGLAGSGSQGFRGFQGYDGPNNPPSPASIVEVYDSGYGWAVNSGSTNTITFNTTRVSDAIYTITQSDPGTSISSSESGNYMMAYTITGSVEEDTEAKFELYNITGSYTVPSTYSYMQFNGGTTKNSVTVHALVGYTAGDRYCVKGTVNAGTPGTVQGVAYASSFSMINLNGTQGDVGSTGPQGFQGPTTFVDNLNLQDYTSSISDKSYVLDLYPSYAYAINTLKIISASGTASASVQIAGATVSGLSSISVSSTIATGTASGGATVSVGNKVTLVITGASSLNNLQASLKITRT